MCEAGDLITVSTGHMEARWGFYIRLCFPGKLPEGATLDSNLEGRESVV
jgi:hypothetical protein